jgi:beta-xylosidase
MPRHTGALLLVVALVGGLALAATNDRTAPQRERAEASVNLAATVEAAPTVVAAPQLHVAAASRFADPAVIAIGNRYFAYATRSGGQNIPVMLSTDLVGWTQPIDALPQLPAWANGRTWAPAVLQRGDRYVMWYTARDRASGRQCISVAVADGPLGPFVDNSEAPAICQLDLGGSIDPEVFADENGDLYLLWKSEDNALGNSTALWSARLSADGLSVGQHVRLLAGTPGWRGSLIEGPAMTFDGGKYYLFYGANRWNTAAAAIGYAECATPLGPCTDATQEAPWLASVDMALGPSGPNFFRDLAGQQRMAYHAWDRCVGPLPCARALYFGTLAFAEGRPVIR